MRAGLYCVVDRRAGQALGGVHVFRHDAPAARMFSDLYADSSTVVAKHPGDFQLVRIGHFDDEELTVTPHELVVVLTGEALAAVQRQEAESA